MPDGTVSGRFTLDGVQARKELRGIKEDAKTADAALGRLGKRFDTLPQQATKVKLLRKEIKGLGTDMAAAERKIKTAMNEKTRAVEKQVAAVKVLRTEIRGLARQRATVNVNVRGLDSALAKLELIEGKIRKLERRKIAGLASGGLGGSGGGSSGEQDATKVARAAKDADRSLLKAAGSAQLFGHSMLLIGSALPAIQALVGAVTALGGSLASAAVGAGATGAAGLGGLLVGGAGIASVGVPTVKSIKDAFTANTALKTAQRQANIQNKLATGNLYAVRNAQEALTNSQQQAVQAQQSLTLARRDALRALQDLDLQTKRSRLGERSSALALRQARAELARVLSDPTASANQIEEARIGLSSAKLDVTQAHRDARRNVKDLRISKRQGVNRAPSVIAAEQSVQQSAIAVRDAGEALTAAHNQISGGPGSAVFEARRERDRLLKRAPVGTKSLLAEAHQFALQWRVATRSGREDMVQFARGTVTALNKLRPVLAKSANSSTREFKKQGLLFAQFLDSEVTKKFIRTGTAIFDENLGNVRRTIQNILTWFGHVVEAARPFFKEFTDWTARATKGWADQTAGTKEFTKRLQPLVDQTKKWGGLIGSVYRLFRDLFKAGTPAGGGLVDSLSSQLDKWDRWVQRNPGKVQEFFKRTADETRTLARVLGSVVKALNNIATALQPILTIVGALAPLLAALPVGGLGALLAGGLALKGGKGLLAGGASKAVVGGTSDVALLAALGLGGRGGRTVAGLGRVGRAAGTVGKVALKRFALFSLLLGGATAATTKGNLGQKISAGVHSIDPFGITHAPVTGAQATSTGAASAQATIAGLQASTGTVGGLSSRIALLRRRIADDSKRSRRTTGSFLGFETIHSGPLGLGGGISQAEANRNAAKVKAYRDQLQTEITARKALVTQIRAEDKARGGVHLGRLETGLGRNVKRLGAVAGTARTVDVALQSMQGKSRAEQEAIALPLAKYIRAHAKGNKEIEAQAGRLEDHVTKKYQKLAGNVSVVGDRLITGTKKQFSTIATEITAQSELGVSAASAAYKVLNDQAVAALKSQGVSQADAVRIVANQRSGNGNALASARLHASDNRTPQQGGNPGRYSGGRLGGSGLQDTVRMGDGGWGAPGELVINRHTEADVFRRYGIRLGAMVGAESRPHSAPMRAKGGRGLTGFSAAAGTNFSVGQEPTIARDLARLGRYLHTTVTGISGYRSPAHSVAVGGFADDPHTRGMAADIGVPGGFLGSAGANAALARFGLYRPFYPASAHEINHVQLLKGGIGAVIASAAGKAGHRTAAGGAFRAIHLPGVTTGLGGVPGGLADSAAALYGGALQHRLNHHFAGLARGRRGGGGPSGTAGAAPRGEVRNWLSRALHLTNHYSPANLNALYGRTIQESGGNPRSINLWDSNAKAGIPSKGLLQTIDPTFNQYKIKGHGNIWNPVDNAIAAIRYMYGRYGHIVGPSNSGYAKGGRIPWFGAGGSATFNKPTLIGVGDGQGPGGSETVTVRRNGGRAGAASGAPVQVTMKFGDVNVGNLKDFKKVAEAAAEVVAEKLSAAIVAAEAHA